MRAARRIPGVKRVVTDFYVPDGMWRRASGHVNP